MKTEEIRQAWLIELHRVEAMGSPKAINSTRRFWKNEWHPYGWQVGFKLSIRFADGQIGRISCSGIGTTEGAAVANAQSCVGLRAGAHPHVQLLWDQLEARDAVVKPYAERVQKWRTGWYQKAKSNSLDKLTQKFHAMRRAALDDANRPSRSLCTHLARRVCAGGISYPAAVAEIVAAGGQL